MSSEHHLPIRATLKAGGGYDAPWLTVDANDPGDLAFKLKGLIEHETALTLVVEAANALKAVNNVAPIAAPVATPGAAIQSEGPPPPWGQTPAAQQQGAATPAPQQNTAPQNNGVRYHPEGKLCPACNAGVIFKTITAKASGKTFELWTCPNQRSKGDGHFSEFAN